MRCAHIALPGGTGLMMVLFLKSKADMDMQDDPGEFAALSSGMECALSAMSESADDQDVRNALIREAKTWTSIADARWDDVCEEFARDLVDIQAYVLVPSSRRTRREGLRRAVLGRFPSALEIVFEREDAVRFAGAGERAIFQSLKLRSHLVEEPKEIAIIDDYIGTGHTIRALARRLALEFP